MEIGRFPALVSPLLASKLQIRIGSIRSLCQPEGALPLFPN